MSTVLGLSAFQSFVKRTFDFSIAFLGLLLTFWIILFSWLAARFDVCFIGWLKDELYRFGIGANNIPEYLFSGKPILHAYSGACDPVSEFGAGVVVEAQNPQAIADAVLRLYNMSSEERLQMGANGDKAAIEHYEYGMLAKKMANVLFNS